MKYSRLWPWLFHYWLEESDLFGFLLGDTLHFGKGWKGKSCFQEFVSWHYMFFEDSCHESLWEFTKYIFTWLTAKNMINLKIIWNFSFLKFSDCSYMPFSLLLIWIYSEFDFWSFIFNVIAWINCHSCNYISSRYFYEPAITTLAFFCGQV